MGAFLTRLFASPKAAEDAHEVLDHVVEVVEDVAVLATCVATQNVSGGIAAVQEIFKDGGELVEDVQDLVADGGVADLLTNISADVLGHVSEVASDAVVLAECVATQNVFGGIAAVQEIVKDGQELVADVHELVADSSVAVSPVVEHNSEPVITSSTQSSLPEP